jgi:hypothetical protein
MFSGHLAPVLLLNTNCGFKSNHIVIRIGDNSTLKENEWAVDLTSSLDILTLFILTIVITNLLNDIYFQKEYYISKYSIIINMYFKNLTQLLLRFFTIKGN